MGNLDLWNSVQETVPSQTKQVNFGRKITAIDPYHQIKNATAKFGPAGKGWGWSVQKVQELPTSQVGVLIRLWHGEPSNYIEHWGQNGLYTDNAKSKEDGDCLKKATTDGVTKCLSCLGFNSDIFFGLYDDNKYVQEQKNKEQASKPVTLSDTDKGWISAINGGGAKLEDINDAQYREFIKSNLGAK
jgi:hypothetical protein